ncbi:MAG: Gfo/Idh/MocA family oxidoreductase [Chloroflexi bacterium]|nr:Gfo/Idh/MocA family oxidoreductase [Chloroflexota bacterium]
MAKLRLIQVGVGGMGDTWMKTISESAEVEYAALVDVNPQVLAAQAGKYHIPQGKCFTTLETALKLPADGLVNVTPPQFHEGACCSALCAGLPVLTEKPLADTMEAARHMTACSQETGKLLMVAQNYRYQPFVRKLHDLVRGGAYGAPGQVQLAFYKGPHFGGFREEMPYPLIIDMSIHHFDMLRYILGTDPLQVTGASWNPAWSWFKGDASCLLHFDFTDAVKVLYHGSWCSTGDETSWSGDWRIECAQGVIVSRQDVVYEALTGEPLRLSALSAMPLRAQAYLLDEFVRNIREGTRPATHSADNIKSLAMVFGAVEAAQTGNTVRL